MDVIMAEQVQEQTNQPVALSHREATMKWLRSTDNVRFFDADGQIVSNKDAAFIDDRGYINFNLRGRCQVKIYLNHSQPPRGDLWKIKDPDLTSFDFCNGEIFDSNVFPNCWQINFQSVIVHQFDVNHLRYLSSIRLIDLPFILSKGTDEWRYIQFRCSIVNLVRHPTLRTIYISTSGDAADRPYKETFQAFQIVASHLEDRDVAEAMDQLFENGLKSFAKKQ
jgi:hypothetical protein